MDDLDELSARAEAEAEQVEAEVERRREAVLAPVRARIAGLDAEVGALRSGLQQSSSRSSATARRVNQEQARHELARASSKAPRSPFPGTHWLAGRMVATALVVAGLVSSFTFCWATVPAIIVAWLVGRSRRDVG